MNENEGNNTDILTMILAIVLFPLYAIFVIIKPTLDSMSLDKTASDTIEAFKKSNIKIDDTNHSRCNDDDYWHRKRIEYMKDNHEDK